MKFAMPMTKGRLATHFGHAGGFVLIEVEEDKIVARPVPNLKEAFGMIKTKKSFSEKELKEIIAKTVAEKFVK